MDTLTAEQKALNRATHHLMPNDARCTRCGAWAGSASITSVVEHTPCPTFVEFALRTLIACRPYVVAADRVENGAVPPLPRLLIHHIDWLLRSSPAPNGDEDSSYVIWIEDPDREHEVFLGYGATRSAWQRWMMLQDQWTCSLFKRIAGPHKKDIKAPPPQELNDAIIRSYWKSDTPVEVATVKPDAEITEAEWERRYKAKLIELGFTKERVDDYCSECGTPDSDAFELAPEEAARNTANFWLLEAAR